MADAAAARRGMRLSGVAVLVVVAVCVNAACVALVRKNYNVALVALASTSASYRNYRFHRILSTLPFYSAAVLAFVLSLVSVFAADSLWGLQFVFVRATGLSPQFLLFLVATALASLLAGQVFMALTTSRWDSARFDAFASASGVASALCAAGALVHVLRGA